MSQVKGLNPPEKCYLYIRIFDKKTDNGAQILLFSQERFHHSESGLMEIYRCMKKYCLCDARLK